MPIKARRIVLSSAAWTCGTAAPASAVPAAILGLAAGLAAGRATREFSEDGARELALFSFFWIAMGAALFLWVHPAAAARPIRGRLVRSRSPPQPKTVMRRPKGNCCKAPRAWLMAAGVWA